jgi:hypothetical protein
MTGIVVRVRDLPRNATGSGSVQTESLQIDDERSAIR